MLCKGYEQIYETLFNLNIDVEDSSSEKVRQYARLGIVIKGQPFCIVYCPFCIAENKFKMMFYK